ncbi:MAG TPA: hypothetical protein VF905_01075 [Nitrospirota bacterium]
MKFKMDSRFRGNDEEVRCSITTSDKLLFSLDNAGLLPYYFVRPLGKTR